MSICWREAWEKKTKLILIHRNWSVCLAACGMQNPELVNASLLKYKQKFKHLWPRFHTNWQLSGNLSRNQCWGGRATAYSSLWIYAPHPAAQEHARRDPGSWAPETASGWCAWLPAAGGKGPSRQHPHTQSYSPEQPETLTQVYRVPFPSFFLLPSLASSFDKFLPF